MFENDNKFKLYSFKKCRIIKMNFGLITGIFNRLILNCYKSMYMSTWIRGKLLNMVMLYQILIEEWFWFCSS